MVGTIEQAVEKGKGSASVPEGKEEPEAETEPAEEREPEPTPRSGRRSTHV